jgi:hypothetical protein
MQSTCAALGGLGEEIKHKDNMPKSRARISYFPPPPSGGLLAPTRRLSVFDVFVNCCTDAFTAVSARTHWPSASWIACKREEGGGAACTRRNEACLCEGQRSLPSCTTADLNKQTAGHLCGRTSTPRTCPHGSSGTAPASFKGTTAMHAHGASLACTSAFAAAITTGLQTCGSRPVESSANENENRLRR